MVNHMFPPIFYQGNIWSNLKWYKMFHTSKNEIELECNGIRNHLKLTTPAHVKMTTEWKMIGCTKSISMSKASHNMIFVIPESQSYQ
jgi:hypothetical protein